MTKINTTVSWRPGEIKLFRFACLFFIVLSIPYDPNLYKSLSNPGFSFADVLQLATYRTSFIPESLKVGTHLEGFYNWGIAAIIALSGTFIWSALVKEKERINYEQLYYWLRVLLRFRLGIALISIGILKLFPILLPKPTLSDYNTEYGDLLLWKIYYLSTSVTKANYVFSLGFLEIIGGVLLLFRRTAAIGAGLLIAVLANIVIVNYVYEIGEQVYSSFLLLIGVVLFVYDFPRFFNLLFRQIKSEPDPFVPYYNRSVARYKPFLKSVLIIGFLVYGIAAYSNWKATNYPYPATKGINNIRGLYDVKSFIINNDTIDYSLLDPIRWQNVVFESWNTLSIRSNEPVTIDSTKPGIVWQSDLNRNFEKTGNAGRHFYRYLYKKEAENRYAVQLFEESSHTKKYALRFNILDSIIHVSGVNMHGDSVKVQLARIPKTYLIEKGRRKPIKIY
ncbi:hypothetical protein A8C56_10935 [Niabella ginsenosidivorans]|uniref:DoxX family protein n=1 Tax=Niabella ginsenosidivorans TaxID=1176587 RepID=A0A1A9I9X9_9BACT|nr:hypothetical protein [Niabella ginsenosidivorans]ANH83859.1 hypothetical protein A8C56_10935 [Niabella ginsenosidivorans]